MFKKIILILALLVTTAGARDYSMTYHEIQIVDEIGRPVTDITNLYIYAPGTTTNAVIYMDRGRQNTILIPMTEASNNTTLLDGYCYWWGPDGYDFSVTNESGVGPEGNTGHLPRTGTEGTIVFPSYLHAISTASYLDGESITMGTGLDWVINGGAVADTISFVPASNNSDFIVGSDSDGFGASFFVYVSDTEGWFIDSSVPSASWTGGVLNCNVSSNYATNINTGTSTGVIHIGDGTGTGAINIGNSAGGIITLDTDESISITADTTFTVTNTTGDQTYTTASSFNIVATENAAETYYLHVNGGTASSIFLFNQTGTEASAEGEVDASLQLKSLIGGVALYSGLNAADAIRLEATGGAAGIIMIENVNGITASAATQFDAAIQLYSKLGGIGLYSLLNDDDSIRIEANGGTDENITIYSNQGTGTDSITLLSDAGGIAVTTTAGAVAISGIGAHTITSTAVVDAANGVSIAGTTAGGLNSTAGGGAYVSLNLTSDASGIVRTLGSWLDITGSSTPTNTVSPLEVGIWQAETGPDTSGCQANVINMEFQGASDNNFQAVYWFNFNSSGQHPTAWFHANGGNNIAFTAETTHTAGASKLGAIAIKIDAINGGNNSYIWVFSDTGS